MITTGITSAHCKIKILALLALIQTLVACGGGEGSIDDGSSSTNTDSKSYNISGSVQKGPFVIGSNVSVQELDNFLTPIGTSLQTTTKDSLGNYELTIDTKSSYIEITASGYYFDEVSGTISVSPLSLSAIADVTESSAINLNILTHISKERIKRLVSEGSSFEEARTAAKQETLKIFPFFDETEFYLNFEEMDLSNLSASDAVLLLASSTFITAKPSAGELSEYLANISSDLQEDGILDNTEIVNSVQQATDSINLNAVRSNLENRYQELGEHITLVDFEHLINRAPVAVAYAGFEQTVDVESTVSLDGSRSSDLDQDELSFNWVLYSKPETSTTEIINPTQETATIYIDASGTYEIHLTVNDGKVNSAEDILYLSTNNVAPIANAGDDLIITKGGGFSLDGSKSTDADGDSLTFHWQATPYIATTAYTPSTRYPIVELLNSLTRSGAEWDFSNEDALQLGPQTTFTLTVTDEHGLSDTDEIVVTAKKLQTFVDNGDGTITDQDGKMWMKEAIPAQCLHDSFLPTGTPCPESSSGYTDWRKPTHTELISLLDLTFDERIDPFYFPNVQTGFYCTSTYNGSNNTAWEPFGSGSPSTSYLRCVRDTF